MPPKRKAQDDDAKDRVVAQARRGVTRGERLSDVNALPAGSYVTALVVARKEDACNLGAAGFMFRGMNLTSGVQYTFVCDTALADKQYYTVASTEQKVVTRSQLISILESARDAVVKVVFHKKVNPDEQERLLTDAVLRTKAERVAKVKEILQGEERTLTGIVLHSDRDWGRTTMVDLDHYYAHPEAGVPAAERQVDHRSLKEVTFKNVCYKV